MSGEMKPGRHVLADARADLHNPRPCLATKLDPNESNPD